MAVQFVCPSCQQPIEVDDQWGDQDVSCPFCHKVVKAPSSSTWQAARVPEASPLRPPPPPRGAEAGRFQPGESARMGERPTTHTLENWAILVAATGWIFLILSFVAANRMMADVVDEIREKSSDPMEQQRALVEEMQKKTAGNPAPFLGLAVGMMLGMGCLIGGIILSATCLIRGTVQRRKAIAALTLSILPFGCVCLSMVSSLALVGSQ